MYHYVRPTDSDMPHLKHLHLDDFRAQLDHFSSQYGFVSKAEFLTSLQDGNPRPGVVLTFDDGLIDHYRYVMPELVDRGLWGIFYISTDPLDQRRFLDVHRIHALLGRCGGDPVARRLRDMLRPDMLSHEHVDAFRNDTYSKQENDESTGFVKRTLNYYIDYRHRQSVIDELMSQFVPDEAELATSYYVTRRQTSELIEQGMMVGSHTISHCVLSKLSVGEQQREIQGSFRSLSSLTGDDHTKTFCYPYGWSHTFTDQTQTILSQEGCEFSFAVEPRDIVSDDLLQSRQALPRYDCNAFPHGQCRDVG